jgi:Tfp pilus assembly protein PilN
MIKINLLNSVTERQSGAVVAVDRRISSPHSRLAVMSIAAGALLAAVIGWDIISSNMALADAKEQLAEQKRVEAELAVVIAEQKELEEKIKNIDARIGAIKKLRDEQKGPSAVLEAMRERVTMVPGLYLESVEQSGDQVTFKGNSPDEQQVTQFGRSLEFSNGLFSNLNIETARAEIVSPTARPTTVAGEGPKLSIVNFTIKTAYTPSKASGSQNSVPTTASVGGTAAPAQPAQIAKN